MSSKLNTSTIKQDSIEILAEDLQIAEEEYREFYEDFYRLFKPSAIMDNAINELLELHLRYNNTLNKANNSRYSIEELMQINCK